MQPYKIDKAKGTLIWKKLLGHWNRTISKNDMTSPSPVTDGAGVYAVTGTGVLKGVPCQNCGGTGETICASCQGDGKK